MIDTSYKCQICRKYIFDIWYSKSGIIRHKIEKVCDVIEKYIECEKRIRYLCPKISKFLAKMSANKITTFQSPF